MPLRLINAQYVEPHLCRDSGWNYVTDGVMSLTKILTCPEIIFVDLFVDRTFLWRHPLNGEDIPHRQHSWFGFIHHPPGVQNSCDNLFASVPFQDALHKCIALIVFSSTLQNHVCALLQLWSLCHRRKEKDGTPLPQVHFVSHPVNVDLLSRYRGDAEIMLPRRRLLHVGHHGRDVEKFYRLSAPGFEKIILTNDFPLQEHICGESDNIARARLQNQEQQSGQQEQAIHSGPAALAFHPLRSARRHLPKRGSVAYSWSCPHQPCRVLPRLSCRQYTAALNRGIIYIHFTDASAVNTLLECVVLRTPVFVNKLPAVVELLGAQYPLYVDSENQVESRLNQDTIGILMEETIDYLSRLDLDRFHIRHLKNLVERTVNRYSHKLYMTPVIWQLDRAPPGHMLPEGGSGFRHEFMQLMEPAARFAQERRRDLRESGGEDYCLSVIESYFDS